MRKQDLPCSSNCGRIVGPKGSHGRCGACQQRVRRRKFAATPWRFCDVDGCEIPTKGPGDALCERHYSRKRRDGHPGQAESLINERGTGGLNGQGYVVRQVDRRRRLEHHWVMERLLGRPLAKWENVHHINGVRADNRPENLELWTRPQPAGQRPEDLAAWVVEHYPDLVAKAMARETL